MAKYTKRFQFKLDEQQPEGAVEAGVFAGYGAVTGNLDDGGDIIEPGAFAETLKDWSRVKIMLQHNYELLPLGAPMELGEDEHGLRVVAKISDTSTGRDVKTLIRDGVVKELSIGYDIPPGGFNIDEQGIRHLTQIELLEISVVTWAMNDQALITDFKAMADTVQREVKEGRKISGKRLQSLKDARDTLSIIIEEADGGDGKARQPPGPPKKTAAKRRSSPALSHSGKQKFEVTL